MRRDVIRAALGRATAALAFGLAATAACSDELTEPPVEAAPAAADGFATTGGDRAVLVALYEATDGPNWDNNLNWLTDAPLDEWFGVGTDASGRVETLSMGENSLTGEIPPELGNLANLRRLRLYGHNLAGEIPPELGKLANLEVLVLGEDDLTGEIPPELGNLASLEQLALGYTALTGEIPPELGKLANLEVLVLGSNGLTGEIPPELGKLANLEVLVLDANNLTGEIPPELGNLASLEWLYLDDNNLTGVIPPELGKLANLRELDLDHNALTGVIPPELGKLASLERLDLDHNALTGVIPPELGKLASLERLDLQTNALTGVIPPELGKLASLERLDLQTNALTGVIPPELGKLASLEWLDLQTNALTGVIPPELGKLASLEWLYLQTNALTGVIPPAFSDLSNLSDFYWGGNAGLCAPGTRNFISFAESLRARGPFCHEADAAVLRSVYYSSGGSEWASSGSWLQPGPLADWYGVETDSVSGRVSGLDLSRNGLSGELPGNLNLASLDLLRELRLDGNGQLGGRLRSGMTDLPLRILSYDGTSLCTPASPAFRTWLRSIPSHSGTGTECPPLTDRDVLEILYESTGRWSWDDHDNWLTDAPLDEWAGVETDASGHVQRLDLRENGLTGEIPSELGKLASLGNLDLGNNALTGEIPPELGKLASLERLRLSYNGLTGVIPPELGKLANLQYLSLARNGLTGVIPPKLGDLANLQFLYLSNNDLTGVIPPELGKLTNLERLYLHNNDLTGQIPPELGKLANLEQLSLSNNDLTGVIPPELGKLANLEGLWLHNDGLTGVIPPELGGLVSLTWLYLSKNDLTGQIPPELGKLANLEGLWLYNNPDLFGALPLANLIKLKELNVGGTEICVPDDSATRLRLRSMWKQYVPYCKAQAGAATATAYIVQAVQSADVPVPLVAGRPGLLRVFVTAPDAGGARIPSGWATFYQRDGSKDSVRVSPGDGAIPAEAETAEGSLSSSANAEVPGDVLRPGAEMVVVLDPEGALDPVLGVPRRIPATGRTSLDVYDMPAFDVTVVPFLYKFNPDSSILDVTNGLTAEDELFEETRRLLPVGPMSVTVHEPVWSSPEFHPVDQTEAIRVMEGGAGYYMGTGYNFSSYPYYLPGKAIYSTPDGGTIAHAFGHNMHLWHAPCKATTDVDFGYPHAGGVAGAWGWDRRSGRLVPPAVPDLMGHCNEGGISDYHFANALRWRLHDEAGVGAYYAGPPTQALLLWGGVDADGAPFLNPAFVFDGRLSLLDGAGAWRIVGEAGDGRVLFSQRFEMAEMADGDGRSSFALALAADSEWADALSRIVLTGPGGSVAMNAGTGPAAALLRDPATGRVRGILHNWSESTAAGTQPDAGRVLPERGLELQVSFGIPRPDAWRR